MLYVTGDLHGKNDVERLQPRLFGAWSNLAPDDCLLVVGDFGLPLRPDMLDCDLHLDDLASRRHKTLFIDGNHEHHALLDSLPTVGFGGSPAGLMRENVLHLRRGYVYDVGGVSLFAFGGASSHAGALAGYPRSERETHCESEAERARRSLDAAGWRVDVVVTHTAPAVCLKAIHPETPRCPTAAFLDELYGRVRFSRWFAGHSHRDVDYSNGFSFVYERILRVGDAELKDPSAPLNNLRNGLKERGTGGKSTSRRRKRRSREVNAFSEVAPRNTPEPPPRTPS